MPLRLPLTLGIALILSAPAGAQYSIDWYTIDGGGGTSTAGDLRLDGTIGQPDAGRATGGGYELTSGFWAIGSVAHIPGDDVESDYLYIGSPAEVASPAVEIAAAGAHQEDGKDDWALF